METVLVVGATGNIGVSAIIGALKSKYNVLAVVRNQASAEKMFQHVGTRDGITVVEADVTSDDGLLNVVEKVRQGALPAFHHVYTCVGGFMDTIGPDQKVDMAAFRRVMNVHVEANFVAYHATMPYLREHGGPNATWTICTGAGGEIGCYGAISVTQGALFALAAVAAYDNVGTNVRCNELFLCYRVDYDSVCEADESGQRMKASVFAKVYEKVLADKQIQSSRVSVFGFEDVEDVKYKKIPTDYGTLKTIYR